MGVVFAGRLVCRIQSIMTGIVSLALVGGLIGCHDPTVSTAELAQHRALADMGGLEPIQPIECLRVSCAPPKGWDPLGPTDHLLYTHLQWRCQDHTAGMGVAYIHTPLPLSARMLIWFAKNEYVKTKGSNDPTGGHLIDEWTDPLGRCWFEAENVKYHVKGYAMTRGNDAWIVYSGYRVQHLPTKDERELAAKAADSVVPLAEPVVPSQATASGSPHVKSGVD
jgi:hypothetical protein